MSKAKACVTATGLPEAAWGLGPGSPSSSHPWPSQPAQSKRREKYSLPWEAPSPEVASVSVREREGGGEQSGPMEGPAPKEREAGRRRPGEAATACPGMLSSHSGCRHKAFAVLCCLSGPEPVPFLPACQGQAQGGAGAIPPVPHRFSILTFRMEPAPRPTPWAAMSST